MSESNKTYIVSHGEKVVELHGFGLSHEAASLQADQLTKAGKRNVRIRLEDPIHPSWPLNFDAA
jgi:hypothetical protein